MYGSINSKYNHIWLLKLEYEKGKNKVDSTPADDVINADAIVNINSGYL